MRLAVQMHCTLQELGERMSAEEFGLWNVFLEEEPIGPVGLMVALANGALVPPGGAKCWTTHEYHASRWLPPPPEPEGLSFLDQMRARARAVGMPE